MQTSILDQSKQAELTQNETLGRFYACCTKTLGVLGSTPPDFFSQFAIQPPDQREHVHTAPTWTA